MPEAEPTLPLEPQRSGLERKAVTLPTQLTNSVETVLHELRLRGQRVSFSGLVEVAIRELLDRPDLRALLERYGARARRTPKL
jgi:hypothetical protein